MALDDQVRKNADALAKELGLDIQQAFGRFLEDVLAQVTKDQGALQAQSDQAVADAKARAEAAEAAVAEAQGAVAQAQADGEARKTQAVTAVKDESAAALQAAISQTRENVAREAAGLVARAREEAAQANAALQADRESRKGLDEEAAVATFIVNLLALLQTLVVSLVLARWALPAIGVREHVEAIAHLVGVAVPVFTRPT